MSISYNLPARDLGALKDEGKGRRNKMKDSKSLSRRSFLTGGAGALAFGALGLAGCTKEEEEEPKSFASSIEWDEETDVVVVGFGGAGASATINAADEGANVILLEKAPENHAGGNSGCCGGWSAPDAGDRPGAAGIASYGTFDVLRRLSIDIIEDEEIHGLVHEYATTKEWLISLGAQETNGVVSLGNGFAGFRWIKPIVEDRPGVRVMYETPAKRLIFDPVTKEVFGVVAVSNGKEINIKAKRGVVLALGGFENNHFMKQTYYAPNAPIYACGTPYNTGDGIPMVAEVGAKMRGFSSIEWGCHCCKAGSEEVGVALAFSFGDSRAWDNAIMVNSKGKRFVNETTPTRYGQGILRPLHNKDQLPELAYDIRVDVDNYINLPMYLICGETKIKKGPIFTAAAKNATNHWAHLRGAYTWSDDNQAEIGKGWVAKANTLEELARKMNIDVDGLVSTVAAYEEACEAEIDKEFGREFTLNPIGEGPYYACELGLGIINTQGGPVRDGEHRVLNYDDQPIKRLYSGGEFGSFYVWRYPGALNVPEALGNRVAGTNAAKEEPWE